MTAARNDSTDLFFETAGDGEPVVLLNGVMMTTQSWVFQTGNLADTYRVVLHDFRGQLRSPHSGPIAMEDHVGDLVALLDRLGIERAHIVGTSYGGEVGMLFALAHPGRVRTLTLIACVSHIEPPLREAVTRWRDASPEELYDVTAPYNFSPDFLTPALLEAGRSRLRAYPPEFFSGFRELCDAFLRLDITECLHEITAPTLVMCGSIDVLKPPRYSEIIASRIPHAWLEIVEGAGHAVFLEKHETINEMLHAFFLDPRGGSKHFPLVRD
jgi:3-oxoadipate enol-lactonase